MATTLDVLHVDDDPGFAELVATALETRFDHFSVDTARSPSAGRDLLGSGSYDCVVSDYTMPDEDGIEFLRSVRETHGDLPFILFTGKGSEEVAADAISAGVTDYLQKGSDPDTFVVLANRIENVVDQHEAERRAADQARRLSLLRDVNQALVESATRREVERVVPDILSSYDPYRVAWFGRYESESDRLVPRSAGGIDDEALSPAAVPADGSDTSLETEALLDRSIRVLTDTDRIPAVWDPAAVEFSVPEAAILPVVYQGDRFGVLGVYAAEAGAFETPERDMLVEIAGDVAQALHAAEIRSHLRRHQTAVENVPDGVFVLDENATIELVNEAGAALVNRTPEDLQGTAFPSLVSDGVFDESLVEWYLDAVGDLLSSATETETVRYETAIHPGTEDVRIAEAHLSLRPYTDEFRGTVGIVRDVTDRRARERDLRESEQRYRSLVETSPIPIVLYDETGTISYVNDAAVEFAAADDDSDLVSRSAGEFIHPDDQELVARRMERVIEERVANEPVEITFVDLNGDEKTAIVSGAPVRDQDRPAGQAVLKDITMQKRRERELQQERDRLDEFVSVVSHDLRTPLTIAEANRELLEEDCDSEYLDRIGAAHERLETLLTDLLQLARQGEPVSDVEAVNLRDLAQRCADVLDAETATVSVEIERTIEANESRLRQLLENLFRNAVEHGGDEVSITIGELADGFFVADDGDGIPPERRDSVFDAGFSTSDTGTGFGLSIVAEIVDAHGWDVRVTEGTDGGARFEITSVETVSS